MGNAGFISSTMGLGFRDDGADAADSVFSYRAQAVALPHESNGVEDVLDTEIRVKSLLLISEEEAGRWQEVQHRPTAALELQPWAVPPWR